MDEPLISVLLPVYNTKEEYLRECIESILNQTFKNYELIILNDGSTNNVEEVVKSYKDSRIKYFTNKDTKGITEVRNKLINLASGKYIAVTDHDDISLPERFEKEVKFLENNPEYSIVSSWLEIFSEKTPKTKIWKTAPFPKYFSMLRRCELSHPACMYRKADFEKYHLTYEADYFGAQDYALFAKAIRYLKFANLQEPLLKYRKHFTNASNNKEKMCMETRKVQKEMLEFLTNNEKEQKMFYEMATKDHVDFLRALFSIRNKGEFKVIKILGLTFKVNRFKY